MNANTARKSPRKTPTKKPANCVPFAAPSPLNDEIKSTFIYKHPGLFRASLITASDLFASIQEREGACGFTDERDFVRILAKCIADGTARLFAGKITDPFDRLIVCHGPEIVGKKEPLE